MFRFGMACMSVVLCLNACGDAAVDDDKEATFTDEVDNAIEAKFRETWAGKDLTIAPSQGEDFDTCVRFTTLPGSCQFVKSVAPEQIYTNTCDIRMLDSGVNISVTCETVQDLACRKSDGVYPENTINQTNSNKTLTGEETSIVGLGDQDWQVGSGLCDAAFAEATSQ